jgi:dienelactone hydrolase
MMLSFLALLTWLSQADVEAQTVHIPGPDGVSLQAALVRPAGDVTGPAVVALHGCGGPFAARDGSWAKTLAAQGHIVLLPDSFGSRDMGSLCRVKDRVVKANTVRRKDALAAAAWLASQPGVPAGGVVLMGWSNGASTALAAGRDGPDVPPGLIRGVVAFYPGCTSALTSTRWHPIAKVLILMGASDDWTPAAPCHALAGRFPHWITLVTYPNTYHDFDAPDRPIKLHHGLAFTARKDGVAHTGTNEAAREDALTRVPPFIDGLPTAQAAGSDAPP